MPSEPDNSEPEARLRELAPMVDAMHATEGQLPPEKRGQLLERIANNALERRLKELAPMVEAMHATEGQLPPEKTELLLNLIAAGAGHRSAQAEHEAQWEQLASVIARVPVALRKAWAKLPGLLDQLPDPQSALRECLSGAKEYPEAFYSREQPYPSAMPPGCPAPAVPGKPAAPDPYATIQRDTAVPVPLPAHPGEEMCEQRDTAVPVPAPPVAEMCEDEARSLPGPMLIFLAAAGLVWMIGWYWMIGVVGGIGLIWLLSKLISWRRTAAESPDDPSELISLDEAAAPARVEAHVPVFAAPAPAPAAPALPPLSGPPMGGGVTMSGQWYYNQDGAQYGPVDESVIVRMIHDGELASGTLVLKEGSMDWQPARKFFELVELKELMEESLQSLPPNAKDALRSNLIRLPELLKNTPDARQRWEALLEIGEPTESSDSKLEEKMDLPMEHQEIAREAKDAYSRSQEAMATVTEAAEAFEGEGINEDLNNLITALREELTQYGGVLALMQEQQQFIINRSADELLLNLNEVNEQMEKVSVARNHREACRRALVAALGGTEETTFEQMTEMLPPEVQPLFSALVEEINQLLQRIPIWLSQNHALLSHTLDLMKQIMERKFPSSGTTTGTYDREEQSIPEHSSLFEAI